MFNKLSLVLVLCLTLGLMPYVPEPHIIGKIRWLAGGGVGMSAIDYADLLFHGFPWILLIRLVVLKVIGKL